MRVSFIFALVLCCAFASVANAQAKIGSTGAQFLSLVPSARAVGMGETGVTLTDPYSLWANPGSLALLGDADRLMLTGWPGTVNLQPDAPVALRLGHVSIAIPLSTSTIDGRTRRRFALAYYHTWVRSGDMYERTYEQAVNGDTGRVFRWTSRSHNLVFSAGFSGRLDIGVGGTVRYSSETFNDETGDQIGFDLGVLVRAPLDRLLHREEPLKDRRWSFTPALGVALKNFGPALDILDELYSQPRALHVGVSTEILLTDRQQVILSFIPALEWRWENSGSKEYLLGVEAGAYEAVYVRAGWIPIRNRDDQKTFGLSVHSRGIARLIWPSTESARGLKCLLRDQVDIEFSYASYLDDDAYFGKTDRFGLSLTLR